MTKARTASAGGSGAKGSNDEKKQGKVRGTKGRGGSKGGGPKGGEATRGKGDGEGQSYREAFLTWLPVAEREVPARERKVLRRDARIPLANCIGFVRALRSRKITDAELKKHLPQIDPARLRALVPIAKALVAATGRVPSKEASDGEIELRLKRLAPLREDALGSAERLARKGFLPEARVRAIREGTGQSDMAKDAVALADLYEEFADAVRDKHLTTAAEFALMREDGQWLIEHLGTGAPGDDVGVEKKTPEADARDAIYSLLDRYYPDALRVAGYFAPGESETIAPKLLAQAGSARAESEEGGGGGGGGGEGGAGGEKTPVK